MITSSSSCRRLSITLLVSALIFAVPAFGQQSQGGITGTVSDSSGAVIPGVTVKMEGLDTGLEQTTLTNSVGSYQFAAVPIGRYSVAFTKDGFTSQLHSPILVQAQRTTTVNGTLRAGEISTEVTVRGTPLLDKVDITNGYVLGPSVIQSTPLGTGSFTQLAVLSPGVSADFLSGSGTNAGLGNQNIWANGQRDTSNSFTFNSVNANNLFNGKSSSSVSSSRFVLNTGEHFLAGGQIQTNTSVYDAIGQGLPTPPPETIQELRVNTSMYDASQGANSGAHIEVVTKSGTNNLHGQAYEYYQTNGWDATPFFLKSSGLASSAPPLHRNVFGATLGGPILKNKMFFFASYQGQRVTDSFNGSTEGVAVPDGLTNDRSASALASLAGVSASQVDPVALAILQAKTKSGQYIVPSQNIFNSSQASSLGYNALVQGPPSTFTADQINANLDYLFSTKDRLSEKYYFQRNPATSPFAISQSLGFPQSLNAGSQVASLDNTVSINPIMTWQQRVGFIREIANASTAQSLTPSSAGLNLLGSTYFPGIYISNSDGNYNSLSIGPTSNFANAGVFQNQFEAASDLDWIAGRHSLSFGFNWDHTQLNIDNRENHVATFDFRDFKSFLTGDLGGRNGGQILNGETNRYYRANQAGAYAQDDIKLKPNLTLDFGLRWDWDGPLSEKYGRLINFYPQKYSFNQSTDTISNIGLVVAGNNPNFGTKGVSPSTLTGRQWGIAPRVGLAWSPSFVKNLVVRAGYGLYYDRGEFFTEFSPSAGLGISGPFGVTTEEPFTIPVNTSCTGSGCLGNNPFGTAALPAPLNSLSGVASLVHNLSQLSGCSEPVTPTCTPTGTPLFAFLFGGYDPANKLPYSENWSLDLQWQPRNDLLLTLGYTGNHGVHELLPIPFNQPLIATPQHPVNGQIYSYGYGPTDGTSSYCCMLLTEQVQTTIGEYTASDGNTALRVPYVGYNPNSNFWEAEGVSNYDALQFSVNKRLSHGLEINGSYTWSHTLDQGSGLQLFYNGNNPLDPASAYGNAGFDRTHVVAISYHYNLPKFGHTNSLLGDFINGWGLGGITVLESGQPFSVYDYSGSVGGLYFSADDFITNPLLPIAQGKSVSQVQAQGTTGVNAGVPYFNPNSFTVPTLKPGQSGVPPCGPTVGGTSTNFCDTVETSYGATGRNIFRAPFQSRFDFALEKDTRLTERFGLDYRVEFFNLFNHPSFDAPNNDVTLNGCYNPQPCYVNPPSARQGVGFIRHTLGSPRFIQMALHLTW